MKKAGILTFDSSTNFGANLQAFALQTKIKEFGYEAEFINYLCEKEQKSTYSKFKKIKTFIWNKLVKKIISGNKREKLTKMFRQKHFCLSEKAYSDINEITINPPTYAAYIVGSDQVWNYKITNNALLYLLSFVPEKKLRISYAASFGISEISDEHIETYRDLLNKFDYVSVREVDGKRIINNLSDIDVQVVLDPTLLLSQCDWEKVASERLVNEEYILCYHMPQNKALTRCINETVKRIAENTGMRIINIGQKEYRKFFFWEKNLFDIGPSEFISLFKNASFVVTNSFHGTAFAINFNKPFYVPINNDISPAEKLSSRMTSLLNTLQLSDRIIWIDNNFDKSHLQALTFSMDFTQANELLNIERKKSIAFLQRALGDRQ